MDKIVQQALYYDFYGELLTEHQKNVYQDAVFHDMSLGEISEELGISRQGVHDLIKRCDRILIDYEEKLHLVERFRHIEQEVVQMQNLVESCQPNDLEQTKKRVKEISNRIIDEL